MLFRSLQRLTAVVMVPLVVAHLAVIIYATRGGLSAAEILDRTQGSLGWGFAYGLFVVCLSVHAAIGIRNILWEWTALPRGAATGVGYLIGLILLVIGIRAVYAVVVVP